MNFQEIRRKYPDYDDLSDRELAQAIHAKDYSDMPMAEFVKKIGLSPSVMQGEVTTQDWTQAGAAGVNKGALANFPGLPVDTALNVWDLAKAGFGGFAGKVGAISPANLPELTKRETIPFSSEWFAAQVRNAGLGKVIDPNRPDDEMSRIAHAGGQAAGFPVPARSIPGAIGKAVQVGSGGAGAQYATEAGAPPSVAVLAGLTPFTPGPAYRMASQRRAKPSLRSAEEVATIDRLKGHGYELTPSQESGKTWQQNVEATLRQAPSTSGRMDRIDQRNVDVTQRLAAEAQAKVGGPISQGEVQAAAFNDMRRGIAGLEETTGSAYKDLLRDVPVDLSSTRQPLEQLRARQREKVPDLQGGRAMESIDQLLGSSDYAAKAKHVRGPASLNPNVDDIVTAIRKMGGITPGDEAVGSLSKANPFPPSFDGPVWRESKSAGPSGTKVGHSLDRMAEMLHEQGYISGRNALDEVMDKIADTSMGTNKHYSIFREEKSADPIARLSDAVDALAAKVNSKGEAPAPKAGALRTRPEIPGAEAQDLRSMYGSKAQAAFDAGGKVEEGTVYLKLKEAVDAAIEQSMPESKKGQFAALNAKYGIDMAVKAMTPKDQASFLAQLYRGSPDQFYTFLGVADKDVFKDVQRGFVANMLEGSRDARTGEVSAAKLGRDIPRRNPETKGTADTMKHLTGGSEPLLRDIASAGRVLPDAVPNSGSAQRLWYQSLLRGGGIVPGVLGAGAGGALGGPLGAAFGAIASQFIVPKALQSLYLSPGMRGVLTSKGKPIKLSREELLRQRAGLLGYMTSLQK